MNYSFLIRTPLFHGLSQEEAEDALNCLGAYEKRYDKDEVILHAGETKFRHWLIWQHQY